MLITDVPAQKGTTIFFRKVQQLLALVYISRGKTCTYPYTDVVPVEIVSGGEQKKEKKRKKGNEPATLVTLNWRTCNAEPWPSHAEPWPQCLPRPLPWRTSTVRGHHPGIHRPSFKATLHDRCEPEARRGIRHSKAKGTPN